MKRIAILTAIVLIAGIYSCRKEELKSPTSYETIDMTNPANQNLHPGRVLFYDKKLSVNNSIACASCHKQEFAFGDNVSLSKGFNNKMGTRNSPPLQHLGNFITFKEESQGDHGFLFWDGREKDLTHMVLKPIVNHVEMGIQDLEQLVEKLEGIPYYPVLFNNFYGSSEITQVKVADALAQFVMSIRGLNDLETRPMTEIESLGSSLFMVKYQCNNCHVVQDPTGYQHTIQGGFANIGLPGNSDPGLGAVTGIDGDNGKFKIPTLRNVALTAPYMHDGRFNTLDEVLDHYSHGMTNHPNLDTDLREANGSPKKFNFTKEEKNAMISFLNTLTSEEMIHSEEFSNPFTVVTD